MTLAELVERYGEAEVTRWAMTGRLAEKVLFAKEHETEAVAALNVFWCGCSVTTFDPFGIPNETATTHGLGDSLLAALEAADA